MEKKVFDSHGQNEEKMNEVKNDLTENLRTHHEDTVLIKTQFLSASGAQQSVIGMLRFLMRANYLN